MLTKTGFDEQRKDHMDTLRNAELVEVASVPVEREKKKIHLVVSDIEGCLNLNEHTYDLEALNWIRGANQLARADNPIPFITVCSGRQHAFVEVITQLISGAFPTIFENGCGLYFPTRSLYEEYAWHPLLSEPEVLSQFTLVRQKVLEEVVASRQARRVPGKEMMLSLHPVPPVEVKQLYSVVTETLTKSHLVAFITRSASAVDITPLGIDKATGVRWLVDTLAEVLPVKLANVAGVGDSVGDVPFLSIVGLSAAPANASEPVKSLVDYCSSWTDGRGVADTIRQCITINMQLR
ncbi:MAG: HAD family phosphatase [Ktedonobacteraceae bacterium]|nr:HAD family phosphatase [Ktedonobacteraceae bacterium]